MSDYDGSDYDDEVNKSFSILDPVQVKRDVYFKSAIKNTNKRKKEESDDEACSDTCSDCKRRQGKVFIELIDIIIFAFL